MAVAVADINGDGKPDLAVAASGWSEGIVSVLLNNGDGTFQAAEQVAGGGFLTGAYSLAAADVNGDGQPDIVVGSGYSYSEGGGNNTAVLLLNEGNPNWAFGQNVAFTGSNSPLSVAMADVNADGQPDIIYGGNGSGLVCVLNNSDGTFSNALTVPGVSGFPFAADLTGSGKVDDLVVSNPGANSLNVFLSVPPVYTIDTPTAHIAANTNVAPTADTANLLLTATDPLGSQELAAGFSYSINWGDGSVQTVDPTANNGSGVAVSHFYTAGDGSYLVSVTATNKDGAVSSSATSLVVVSSQASDNITFSGGAARVRSSLRCRISRVTTAPTAPRTWCTSLAKGARTPTWSTSAARSPRRSPSPASPAIR